MVVNHCQKCGGEIIEEDGDLFCRKCFWHIKETRRKAVDEKFRGEREKNCKGCNKTFLARWRQEYCPECLKERNRIANKRFKERHKDPKFINSNWEN